MYLGGYEKEDHAAEAYDMAALKTKGFNTVTNFSKDKYAIIKTVSVPVNAVNPWA